jgi:hypothetical protein
MESLTTRGSAAAVGTNYLQLQSRTERRLTGRVYTPSHIVDFVLGEAGYDATSALSDKPILDPACGAGAFIEQIIAIQIAKAKLAGLDVSARAGFNNLLEQVERRVWAVDCDKESCGITRQVAASVVERLTGLAPPRAFLARNVLCADFLLDKEIESFPPVEHQTLGLVIGNPPYVPTDRIGAEYKARLRSRFLSAAGRLDLYTLFVERALGLVSKHGRVALITPDKFLKSYSARRLRTHLMRNAAVRSIASFSSHKVFDGAATVPCVTVVEKGGVAQPIRIRDCSPRPKQLRVHIVRERMIPHFSDGQSEWDLQSVRRKELIGRLTDGHSTLSQLAIRISAGSATGRDAVFLVPPDGHGVEEELLRPAIRGRDIARDTLRPPKLRLLVPYTFDHAGAPGQIRLADYPGAARHLEKYSQELRGRHCVRQWGKAWYEFHDTPKCDLTSIAKILVPDVADSNRFAIDEGQFFPMHSAYYIIALPSVDLRFLTAVLNSTVTAFLIGCHSPVVKDGFRRYRQQFLRNLPVPSANAREARAIARAADNGDEASVDEAVARLFGLTERSFAQVRAAATAML